VSSTEEFVERLRGIDLPDQECYLVRIDMAHFYMSGEFGEIVEDVLRLVPKGPLRQLMGDVLWHLLDAQFVRSPLLRGRTFKVVEGSGMGLVHSGAVSDLALCARAEISWACRSDVQDAHQILCWLRFRDDIFVVGADKGLLKAFYSEFSRRCKYFETEVVQWSRCSVSMLQTNVRRVGRRLVAAPKFKGCNSGMPLDRSSCHAAHVHASWPCAFVRSLGRLSTWHVDAVHAKMIFLRRLESHHAPEDLVEKLRQIGPQPIRRGRCTVVGSRTLWIVLGFHPALHERGLSRVVARLSCDPGLRALWRCAWGSEMPRLRLAWRNDLSNVARRALGLVHQLREFEV